MDFVWVYVYGNASCCTAWDPAGEGGATYSPALECSATLPCADYFLKCIINDNTIVAQVGNGQRDHSTWNRPESVTTPNEVNQRAATLMSSVDRWSDKRSNCCQDAGMNLTSRKITHGSPLFWRSGLPCRCTSSLHRTQGLTWQGPWELHSPLVPCFGKTSTPCMRPSFSRVPRHFTSERCLLDCHVHGRGLQTSWYYMGRGSAAMPDESPAGREKGPNQGTNSSQL